MVLETGKSNHIKTSCQWFAGNSIDQLPASLLSPLHNLEELDLADNQLTSLQALPLPRYDDDADADDEDDDDHDDEEDADDTGKPGINITGNQLNSRQYRRDICH